MRKVKVYAQLKEINKYYLINPAHLQNLISKSNTTLRNQTYLENYYTVSLRGNTLIATPSEPHVFALPIILRILLLDFTTIEFDKLSLELTSET